MAWVLDWFDELPVEVVERVVFETTVARWTTTTHTDVSHVLREIGDVSSLWSTVVSGIVFQRSLSSRILKLVRQGKLS